MNLDYSTRAEILTLLAASGKSGEELLLTAWKLGRDLAVKDEEILAEKYQDGYDRGHKDGYDEGYEDGANQ